jgi:hypothetical protein
MMPNAATAAVTAMDSRRSDCSLTGYSPWEQEHVPLPFL